MCRSQQLQDPYHLIVQLKVSDNMIAIAIEHFDVSRQMLAIYGWGTSVTDEHYDGALSFEEYHALRETIKIMRHNYLQLLVDRRFLLERDCICYDAMRGGGQGG